MLSQIIKIGADATGAQRVVAGLAGVTNKAFSSVGKEITNRLVGAFAAGVVIDKIAGFVANTINYADNLGDMAENLGMTTEEVQQLQVASGLAGVKFTKLLGVIDKINAAQAQAVDGSDKKAVALFARLGLDPKTATAMDIMRAAIANQAAGADLLGKRFNNVANVMDRLKALGPIDIIKQEQIDAMGEANDKLDEANRKLRVAAAPSIVAGKNFLAGLLTALQSPVENFKKMREIAAGGTEGGVDLSALPIDPNRKSKKQQNQPPTAPPLSLALQSDALGRIGLFVGGRASVGDQLVSIGNYQLSELRAVRQILQEANR